MGDGRQPLRLRRFGLARDPGDGGFVDESDITGRAEVIFWPASNWSRLNDGRGSFADVPEQP